MRVDDRVRPWYVLTGAPGAGKTTLMEALSESGLRTVPEIAREVLMREATAGKTAEETRRDERRFQEQVLRKKVVVEEGLATDALTVFDRGIPDSLAYFRLRGWPPSPDLENALAGCRYAAAFLLEPLPEVDDDPLRIESVTERAALSSLLQRAYGECGFEVIHVPAASVEERVSWLRRLLPLSP